MPYVYDIVSLFVDVYICGGFDTQTIFGDIWKFSLQTNTWSKLPCSLQVPVYFHSADITSVKQWIYFKVSCIALTVLFSKWGVRVLHRKKILPHFFRDSVSGYITGAWLPISHVMKVVWVYPRLILSKAPYS